MVRAIADSSLPVISAVGHEIDLSLSDLVADVYAPTPSAAAEMVSANRVETLHRVEEIARRMESVMEQRTERIRLLLARFSAEDLERNFRMLVQPILLRLDDAKENLVRGMKEICSESRHRLELLGRSIDAASPEKILGKGYALVSDARSGALLTKSTDSAEGRGISIRLAEGSLGARITEVKP